MHDVDETEERMNKQLAEAAKRENVLVLRLSAREQELQDVAAVAVKYRQQQVALKLKVEHVLKKVIKGISGNTTQNNVGSGD